MWTDWLVPALVGAAIMGFVAILIDGARHRILFRMGTRNALRRPRQTLTVIAGLMVGTAIISSALVAGDSARDAIRGYVYQSLGEVDESVAIPGYAFFPQTVATTFQENPPLTVDGAAGHLIWQGAASTSSGLFEPAVAVVGFEPEADAAFGTFSLTDGSRTRATDLQPGEAIITDLLANALQVAPGDEVRVSYVLPIDPFLPEFTFLNGTVPASFDLPGVPAGFASHTVTIGPGTTQLTVALAPIPGAVPANVLVRVISPDGSVTNAQGSPAILNVTSAPDAVLPVGDYQIQVRSSLALPMDYRGVAVSLRPVYDLALLSERRGSGPANAGDFLPQFQRHEATFRVAHVTDGGRGDLFDLRQAMFIRLDDAQTLFAREGQINLLKFTNVGDARHPADTPGTTEKLNATLNQIKADYPEVPSIQALEVRDLKSEFLQAADNKGRTLTNLLVFAGSLSITTGILLILNIFTMLAEERRSELGMARAVGLGRRDLIRLSLYEGSLYALGAAVAGAFLGLLLAFAMIWVLNTIIANLGADLSFPPIAYRPSWSAVVAAVGGGGLLTMLTIFFASRRQSRINVVRAIRRIDEPQDAPPTRAAFIWGLAGTIVGGLMLLAGWIPNPISQAFIPENLFSFRVFGAVVLAGGLYGLLRSRAPRRQLLPSLAGGVALYYALTYFLITRYDNPAETNLVGPIRGVLLSLAVVMVVIHVEAIPRVLGRFLGRFKALRSTAMPAVSYPLHKKFRTGMTLAMFSIVILSIGFFSIFGALFQSDPTRQTGGYDIEARTTLSVPDLAPYDRGLIAPGTVTDAVQLSEFRSESREFITVDGELTGTFRDYRHVVYGYDEAFARTQQFGLTERLEEYASDQAAYDDVLTRTDRVIVSYIYSTNAQGQSLSHHVGETLQIHLGQAVLEYTIAGIQEQYHFPGIFLPREHVDSIFTQNAHVYLYKLSDPATAPEVAKTLEANYRDVGMDAKASLNEVLEEQESFRQVLGAMKLFLGLSLVVGVLSLGIITSRSVLERRQEIGMLRALGFTGRQVRRIFFVEVTFTILLGAVVGIACAILVTFGLWFAIIRELNYPYVIPWLEMLGLVAISYVVALLATWAPIGRSAKVAPAEALRYIE